MSIVKYETGSNGNVFHDLKVEDADNLRIRALLMFEIEQYIQEKELTQDKAAEVMQTTQPYYFILMCIPDDLGISEYIKPNLA